MICAYFIFWPCVPLYVSDMAARKMLAIAPWFYRNFRYRTRYLFLRITEHEKIPVLPMKWKMGWAKRPAISEKLFIYNYTTAFPRGQEKIFIFPSAQKGRPNAVRTAFGGTYKFNIKTAFFSAVRSKAARLPRRRTRPAVYYRERWTPRQGHSPGRLLQRQSSPPP